MRTAAILKWNHSLLAFVLPLVFTCSLDAQLFRRNAQYHSFGNQHSSQKRSVVNPTSVRGHVGSKSLLTVSAALPESSDERLEVLRTTIDAALDNQIQQWETSESRSPWGVMHNSLAWGIEGEILIDGQKNNSIGSLCENRTMKTVKILTTRDQKLVPIEGPGRQGHPGQLLAILAQNAIATEQPIEFDEFKFTVKDLIQYEKLSCSSEKELTFKLLALCHYCGTDATWTNENGEQWSVERLLKEELGQPINRVTCGGTHRLMAIGLAVSQREREVEKLDGIWRSAATYIQDYHEYAYSLMNPDGSFSTEWFERRAAAADLQKRLQTTGHVLEWLVLTVPDEDLDNDSIQKSVYYLGQLLQMETVEPWSVGPRAHALRALRLYKTRVNSRQPETRELVAAADAEVTVAETKTE